MRDAVNEFEDASTPEARCAKDADKLEMLLQAKPSFLSGAGAGDTAAATSFSASLTMSVTLGSYGSCESGGYGDIRSGAQVEIVNQKHEVIALGTLRKSSTGTCEFEASIKDIPVGEKMYGAKVGNANRGVIWQSENDARTMGWALTLGG